MVLRDSRFSNFNNSFPRTVKSSVCSGLISFDCYLNFTVDLNDKNSSKTLILQIKPHNYKIIEGFMKTITTFKMKNTKTR